MPPYSPACTGAAPPGAGVGVSRRGQGRQRQHAMLQIPLCRRRSFPSPNYGGAAGTRLARLDPGVRPGSEGQPRSKDSADVF